MTILYPTSAPVKPARPFGAGILPPARPNRRDTTPEDRAWWAAETDRREDARWDDLAAESASLDRLEAGYCC
jgi:hypothetical protein